ncbi:hypothetical protein DXX93_10095 [Thalassotalea euphylliae]|uniref:Lipoprotein n=1 Tax=Thalassotalea euphylliae TaxID=1655234 RepID=A0A3E0TQK9_9GAMM|nr:hypothetical protein [Thalassotalea euphylliae]REL26886.1 hypothetical protein DXX93_10095 [Thalassotalea euphylliae]
MKNSLILSLIPAVLSLTGCQHTPVSSAPTKSFVIVGESNAGGVDAAQELQLAINRSQTVGCKAISVGGYGAGGEGMVLGIAALISCPLGVHIIPTGFPYDANTGVQIPVNPADVLPPPLTPAPTP